MNAMLQDFTQPIKYQLRLEDQQINILDLRFYGTTSESTCKSWMTNLLSSLTEFSSRKTFHTFIFKGLDDISLSVPDVELFDKLITPFFCAAPPAPRMTKQFIELHWLTITSEEKGRKIYLRSLSQSITALQQRSISFTDSSPVSESALKRLETLDIDAEVQAVECRGMKRKYESSDEDN